jgi:phosphoribosylamine--glycine ligase
VADFCAREQIALVVIGPNSRWSPASPTRCARPGWRCRARRGGARLEGSKGFTKLLCAQADIPTARFARASNIHEAEAALDLFGLPVVIKADGLAAARA